MNEPNYFEALAQPRAVLARLVRSARPPAPPIASPQDLPPAAKRVLELFERHPVMTRAEMMGWLDMPSTTAKNAIKRLLARGLLAVEPRTNGSQEPAAYRRAR